MRKPRAKVDGDAYYHVMSRCALQTYLLADGEEVKDMFMRMLRRAEYFSGVKILNYCVMDNHFHLLLFVPKRREVNEAVLRDRVSVLYGKKKAECMFAKWDELEKSGNKAIAEKEKSALRKRMYELSEFMKTFKQRFSLWYCSNHDDMEGTIWQGAFHSVLVEGKHDALGAISTYITLNPVRAGIVKDAGQFAWSGYGAACSGDIMAKDALLLGYANGANQEQKWKAYCAMIKNATAGTAEGKVEREAQKNTTVDTNSTLLKSGDAGGTETSESDVKCGKGNDSKDKSGNDGGKLLRGLAATRMRERLISRGLAFGSRKFVEEAIHRAMQQSGGNGTPSHGYCMGEKRTALYFASRHTA